MLTILVEIIMSLFITNFKASEHPIINIIVRGIIFTITALMLGVFIYVKDGKEFPIVFGLTLSVSLGVIVTLLMFFVEVVVNYLDKKK